jgi:NADPH:quinone reductase-like Zn-dependent oxidoreductase
MKAAIITEPGAVPRYGDFAEPVVSDGRQIVELVAAGIHPVVRSLAHGRHYGSTNAYPLIPGVDAVARTAGGQLVYTGYVAAPYGTIADRMAVPSFGLPLPAGADPVQIAGGLNPGGASWLPLKSRVAEVGSLGAVVVLGATGMAGLLAVQNARLLGASRVIGAGRSQAGLDRAAAAGATTVQLTGDAEDDAVVLAEELAAGEPGLVLDFIWGTPAEAMFAALSRRGMHEDTADIAYIQIGALAGPTAAVPAALLRSRRIRISGSGAGSVSIDFAMAELPALMQLIADGRLQVPTRTFPLSQVADGWIAASESGSRVVVVPDSD